MNERRRRDGPAGARPGGSDAAGVFAPRRPSWRRAPRWRWSPSVGFKFGVIVAVFSGVIFALAIAVLLRDVRAREDAKGEEIARATAERLSAAVQKVFEDAFSTVDVTHDALVEMRASGVRETEAYGALLRRMIAGGDRFGAWLAWDGASAPVGGGFDAYVHLNGMDVLRERVPEAILASDLYRVPRRQSAVVLLEPHAIDAANGDPTPVTSFARPLEVDGEVTGVLAVDIKTSAIADAVDLLDLPQGASLAVVSPGGMVAAESSALRGGVDRGLHRVGDLGSDFADLFERAKQGDGAAMIDAGRAPRLAAWSAIRFGTVREPWLLLMTVPRAALLRGDWRDGVRLATVCGAALLAILVLVMATMRSLVGAPLARLSTVIGQIGDGLFDLRVSGARRADEIGDIARAVIRLQDSRLEIARLHEENGEREYQRALERETDRDVLAGRFSQSAESVAGSLKRVALTVGDQSRELAEAMGSTHAQLNSLARSSATMRSEMGTAADATTALIASVEAIGVQVRIGRDAAREAERDAGATDASLAELRRTARDVCAVVRMIRSIAEQVNLIALNATIEAARAGASGRGFSVVASEVKTLAARTATATGEVEALVAAIAGAVETTAGRVVTMRSAFVAAQAIATTMANELDVQAGATDALRSLVDAALHGAAAVEGTAASLSVFSGQVDVGAEELSRQSATLNVEIDRLDAELSRFFVSLQAC